MTTENPGKPGKPINQGSAVYPDGTDKAGLTDTVDRTITYKMSDGSKAPASVNDSLTFTATKTVDKVTGEVLSTEWSKNQDFKDVPSPAVTGYTPRVKTVSNTNVAHDAQKINVVVIYDADAQKATVAYIDDKTGTTLKTDSKTGVTNAKSGYTTADSIKTYQALGYKLVSDDTKGAEVVFDNDDKVDQRYTVHFVHDTVTVTTENPGKQTVTYVYKDKDGKVVKTKKVEEGTTFTGNTTKDEVTGETTTTWEQKNHTYKPVNTPVEPGYTADKKIVGGETVTPDNPDRSYTVVYTPNGSIVPVDPNGNPGEQGDTLTPEPTPEPEPTPNPTLDDQPDSEISSDEHFENVKPKDKLDKTNPKKVDAYKKQRKIIKTKIAKQGHTEIAEPIEDKVTRENNVKVVSDPVENMAAELKLPQTGEADNSIIGLLGMLLASFAAMFGFDSLHSHDKKHKN